MDIQMEIATEWVQYYYGITGEASQLPGEVDLNFKVRSSPNECYIFKVSEPGANEELIGFQTAMLNHLNQSPFEIQLPAIVPTLEGDPYILFEREGEDPRILRMLSWVPGRLWADVRPKGGPLLASLGQLCGTLSHALQNFDHPVAHRYLKWDPLQLEWISPIYSDLFSDLLSPEEAGRMTGLLDQVMHLFRSKVLPIQDKLRKGVNHNDANDYNILVGGEVDNPQAICLVDFGDAVYTYVINELAIAIAYGVMGQKDPLSAACEIVKGYHEKFPLNEEDCSALFPLVLARLAISICCAAQNAKAHPENTYLQISYRDALALLDQFVTSYPASLVEYRVRDICGFEPCPQKLAYDKWVQGQPEVLPLITFPAQASDIALLDLSVGSPDLGNHANYRDPVSFQKRIDQLLIQKEATIGIGGYGEIRSIYSSDTFQEMGNQGPQWRTVHLGVDVWVPVGTAIHSPLDGRIFSVAYNEGEGNYGYTLICEHVISSEFSFYLLYGHLSREIMEKYKPGDEIKAGEIIARLGTPSENGAWPPHLHFQVLLDVWDNKEDFPGVAYYAEQNTWKSICPNPQFFFPVPIAKTYSETASNDRALLKRRGELLGKSLSISYDKPLHMVKGHLQYLIDTTGRRYLDLVNNVAHVGHEHPQVVEAAQRQIGLLNTNTRYLHPTIVEFAEELLSTFPEELCVCHFVNSGSEANELALRMAKTYTGQTDMLAIQIGYHGNTGACIDVSSYKFDGKGGKGAPPHTHIVPMPDIYRGIYRDEGDAGLYYAAFVEEVCHSLSEGGRGVAGFIGESILSCGGQVPLPKDYLKTVYHYVRQAGGLCISDEVQVGIGRVGKHFWGFQLQGVIPDIVSIGKPLGNGHPLAAVVCTRAVADAFANGMEYFSTFGGNPVSCAIGKEVLDIVKKEKLQENALEAGDYFKQELESLQADYPILGDIRGHGLFLGIELVTDPLSKEPAAHQAHYLINRMRQQGILMSTDGPDHNVLKVKPPLCITHADIDFVLERLRTTLEEDALQVG